MPGGRRSVARERAAHATIAPARFRALYALLTTHLPDKEHVLVGQLAILAHLHHLGLRRNNGHPLTWRIVRRWYHHHDFPLLLGAFRQRIRTPSLTSSHMISAWIFSRFANDERGAFRVVGPDGPQVKGKRPRKKGVGSGRWSRDVAAIVPDELAPAATIAARSRD